MVTVRDFTKFHIPPPLSFEFEKISQISPYPGAEKLINPLYSPGWPGVLPLGEADDMCIRLALLTVDLGFRFHVSATTVSSIFITWVKLMSKELSVLIVWPSRQQVKKTLPSCFRKLYPKVRCIIDCFECFTETPSGLDLTATLWSEYKHHYTYKVLVAITPNGAISYVSSCYGGRASDIFIVRNSGFLKMIEPYDEIMARGLRSEKT